MHLNALLSVFDEIPPIFSEPKKNQQVIQCGLYEINALKLAYKVMDHSELDSIDL